MSAWATILTMRKSSPLSEIVAARCPPELITKLDALREVLLAASPSGVRLSRSEVARAALEVGADELLRLHNPHRRVP